MEDNSRFDSKSLLERATEYGKTSIELVKLKTLDKTTDIVSSSYLFLLSFYLLHHSCFF